jgi:chaperone required for assembly of F1-ATPase
MPDQDSDTRPKANAAGLGEKPPLPKRFYKDAVAEAREGGFALLLDGRGARTPGRNPLVVPSRALADAMAAEWNAQGEVIDPATMPLTKLANTTIDGVAPAMESIRNDIARYASSDLVCYRAGDPDRLVAAQTAAWDPVLAWARDHLGAQFVMSVGVIFVQQPELALSRIRARLGDETSPYALSALHVFTTLTGSLLIALMVAEEAIEPEAAWRAAHVDEFHQESLWGEDYEAAQRRANRHAEFMNAVSFLKLSRAG